MVASSRKTLKKNHFGGFCRKTIPYGEIFKILFRKDSSRHRSTCYVQISWNLADGKSVKIVRCLPDKKIRLALQPSMLCGSRPKSATVSPEMSWRVLQISPKSVHLRRSYSRTREHRQSALESESKIRLKPSFDSFQLNKNCSLYTLLTATGQEPQKIVKRQC